METKFQTSFIPKRPLIPPTGLNPAGPKRSFSYFMVIAVLIFIISLGVAGGSYFWKSYLESAQIEYKAQLAQRERQFNPNLIEDLKRQNIKIDTSAQLIANHIATSYIFDIIGRFTIEQVRFVGMDMTMGATRNDGIKIVLKGYGTTLSAVAWQSDVLSQLERYGLRKVVKNPMLTDPALDSNGLVAFGLTATVDPVSLSYQKNLEASVATSTSP